MTNLTQLLKTTENKKMAKAPLIGITGRRKKGNQIEGVLPIQGELDIDMFFASYGNQVSKAGGIPVLIPRNSDIELIERLDGIILSGGADIDPSIHSPNEDPSASKIEPGRDSHELDILDITLNKNMPVLGICRGLQVINVHAGGTLFQDIPDHANLKNPADDKHHKVKFEKNCVLSNIYGPEIEVNSLHHQAINKLGEGIRPVGWSVGGEATQMVVEAIESINSMVLAVQWHPELLPGADPVFTWLIEQASK